MSRVNLPLLAAGLSGASAVALGAYGYHGLAADEAARDVFMIGVQYQAWHALALLVTAWLAETRRGAWRRGALAAAAAFVVGTVLFCGSLYVFAATGDLPLAGAAPAGGFVLFAGWLMLAAVAFGGHGGDPSKH